MRQNPRPLPPYNIAMNLQESLYISFEREKQLRSYMPSNIQAEKLAEFFAVCADPTRVKILSALAMGDMCVGDIALVVQVHQSTVSHQLKTLKDKGMVVSRKIGRVAYYSLSDPSIESILNVGAERISKRASYAV